MSAPFRVMEIRCLHANCWGAKCACGTWLTKHDFDAEEARQGAIEILTRTDRWGHRCDKSAQLTLTASGKETP
jgi:hypothetical protein